MANPSTWALLQQSLSHQDLESKRALEEKEKKHVLPKDQTSTKEEGDSSGRGSPCTSIS